MGTGRLYDVWFWDFVASNDVMSALHIHKLVNNVVAQTLVLSPMQVTAAATGKDAELWLAGYSSGYNVLYRIGGTNSPQILGSFSLPDII